MCCMYLNSFDFQMHFFDAFQKNSDLFFSKRRRHNFLKSDPPDNSWRKIDVNLIFSGLIVHTTRLVKNYFFGRHGLSFFCEHQFRKFADQNLNLPTLKISLAKTRQTPPGVFTKTPVMMLLTLARFRNRHLRNTFWWFFQVFTVLPIVTKSDFLKKINTPGTNKKSIALLWKLSKN